MITMPCEHSEGHASFVLKMTALPRHVQIKLMHTLRHVQVARPLCNISITTAHCYTCNTKLKEHQWQRRLARSSVTWRNIEGIEGTRVLKQLIPSTLKIRTQSDIGRFSSVHESIVHRMLDVKERG